jgi:SNF2 family DNA or RNA helicase
VVEPKPATLGVNLAVPIQTRTLPGLDKDLQPATRAARLLGTTPWVHSAGKLHMTVSTTGWRFPSLPSNELPNAQRSPHTSTANAQPLAARKAKPNPTRLRPCSDTIVFKDRLFYLLQPPLENLFAGKQVQLSSQPYPYQMEGIAFLMPRHAALLADEMGLGKSMQAILSLRLLFQTGMIRNALLVCPKPLVPNWCREIKTWAANLPFEVIGGDALARRAAWQLSNCPLKLVNYELLTRDADLIGQASTRFDVVLLDEAQRIKNHESKTAQVVRAIPRHRSWALTGTPIENRSEDLISLFSFVDPHRILPEASAKSLASLTADCILRRTKEEVLSDLPPKTIRDALVELTPAQRAAYDLAEKEGVVRLNTLGDMITVQHVFELVLRLKQICNFDPLTNESAKLERLEADLAEVADSGRKAIVFSQWVEPLEWLAKALAHLGPVQFHGKISPRDRHALLERFRKDPSQHVILMSYGTGSVGLNLQFTNYVFLFDRWWNPAVEDQAINRAHRIGQREPVFVTRFITPDTIEGRIAEVLERKRQLFQELLEQNEPPAQLGLTEEEIFGLFNIVHRPRRSAA